MKISAMLCAVVVFICSSFNKETENTNSGNLLESKVEYYERQFSKALALNKVNKLDSSELILKTIANKDLELANPELYVKVELNLGKIYSDRGNNVLALPHYQTALKTAEQIKDKASLPHIYKNIGVLYVQWKKFDEALNYYNKAEELAKDINNEELVADCENNKGIIYEQQGHYEKALKAYQSALKLYVIKNIPPKIAMAYSNIAIVYKLQKRYQESVSYNLKAIAIHESEQDTWSMAATYNNIGNLYGELKEYEKAKEYLNKSISIAQKIQAEEIIGMAYESFANAAANVNEYKEAFKYHQLYSVSRNRFINEENTKHLSELSVKYESEKKEKEIAEAKLTAKQKNIWLILLGSVLLLSLFVFRNFRAKAKHKQQQLALENELLKEQTHSKMQEQRLEISRDLHDSIGAQLTFINSILDSLKNSSLKLDDVINSKINSLSDFSENSITELKNTLWVLNSKEINLNDLKIKILNFINNASEAKEDIKFHFNFDIQENLNLNSKQAVNLFRAIQEIINNTLKYANASEINIEAIQDEKHLIIKIADDGKGFDYDKEKNKSYGLTNIQQRIEAVNGTVELITELNKGTAYTIKITL